MVSGHPSRSCADQRWVEAMFADLQRQLDDLSGQLQALTQLVQNCTRATRRYDLPGDSGPPLHEDGSDG